MYHTGEKIVYPMHGAGIIEKIEEKKILGESRKYYVLNISCSNMKIMIPVDSSDEIGVRTIIPKEEMELVIAVLKADSSEMPENWNRRQRENMEKLKTGNVLDVAEVVRNLTRADRRKRLSAGEKKMLDDARQILLSELILVSEMDFDNAFIMINEAV